MIKKILIINIFGIGDVLFTTPLISNIKRNIPDAFLGYISNRRTAPMLMNNPKINKVFVYEKDEWRVLFGQSKIMFIRKISAMLSEIRKEKFDVVIDVSLNKYSSFLMWLIGIKVRVGYNYKNRSPFLTTKIFLKGYEKKHVVDYYLDLLKILGIPAEDRNLELFITDDEKSWAQKWLLENAITARETLIAVVPGGGASWGKDASYKRWASNKYAQLADKVVEKCNCRIILMGDVSEEKLCQEVAGLMKHKPLSVSSQTSIGQMASLLKRCKMVIVNDGGPLHIAVASGVRTVSIFGPVDEKVYGPYPFGNHVVVKSAIVCRPCYRRFKRADCEHINCLNKLEVNDVLNGVEKNL